MSSILLSTDRIKSLYFEENTEIQAFLLPTENSFNCNFAVACKEKTGKIHTNSHEIHTTIGGINVIERSQLPLGSWFSYSCDNLILFYIFPHITSCCSSLTATNS